MEMAVVRGLPAQEQGEGSVGCGGSRRAVRDPALRVSLGGIGFSQGDEILRRGASSEGHVG